MNLSVRIIRWGLANSLLAGIAFVCAGGLTQSVLPQYLFAYAILDLVSALAVRPALASERSRPPVAGIDPAVRPLASFLFLATVAFGALDVGRIHWALPFAKRMQVWALAVFVAGNALQIWAMAVNRFFSTELRIQAEAAHQVIKNGPYRCVRHPGYLAMLLIVPSTPFALGSSLALLPAAIYAAAILFRVEREDRFLFRSLPGYANYIQGTPYRLIPGIW
jgi:protein-S-isoprenylcysteine O-methyltransferase Ste14